MPTWMWCTFFGFIYFGLIYRFVRRKRSIRRQDISNAITGNWKREVRKR